MGFFDKKDDDELETEFDEMTATDDLFDAKALKTESDDVTRGKQWRSVVGSAADAMANVPSLGALMRKSPQRESQFGKQAEAFNETVEDPWTRRKALLEQLRAKRDHEQAGKVDARDAELDDAESTQTKAMYDAFQSAGIKVPMGKTARQLQSVYGDAATYLQKKYAGDQDVRVAQAKEAATRGTELAKLRAKSDAGYTTVTDPVTGEERLVKNGRQLPPDKVLSVNEGNQMPKLMEELATTLDSNKDLFGPVAGRAATWDPWNERGQVIQSQLKTSAQLIGKFLEGGVLKKEDEVKYEKMLPTLTDPPAVAKAKMEIIHAKIAQKQSSNLAALKTSGFDTRGVELDAAQNIPGMPEVLTRGPGKKADVGEALMSTAHAKDKKPYHMMTDEELDEQIMSRRKK